MVIDADGYVKICDFGFAKKLVGGRTFTKCGTEEYAAPEVVNGHGRSCAADWWSLGILLHEMLTGIPPFQGDSGWEVQHAHFAHHRRYRRLRCDRLDHPAPGLATSPGVVICLTRRGRSSLCHTASPTASEHLWPYHIRPCTTICHMPLRCVSIV